MAHIESDFEDDDVLRPNTDDSAQRASVKNKWAHRKNKSMGYGRMWAGRYTSETLRRTYSNGENRDAQEDIIYGRTHLSREEFELIWDDLERANVSFEPFSKVDALIMTLFYISQGCGYYTIGDIFQVDGRLVGGVVNKCLDYLATTNPPELPNTVEEVFKHVATFEAKTGMPNMMGIVDTKYLAGHSGTEPGKKLVLAVDSQNKITFANVIDASVLNLNSIQESGLLDRVLESKQFYFNWPTVNACHIPLCPPFIGAESRLATSAETGGRFHFILRTSPDGRIVLDDGAMKWDFMLYNAIRPIDGVFAELASEFQAIGKPLAGRTDHDRLRQVLAMVSVKRTTHDMRTAHTCITDPLAHNPCTYYNCSVTPVPKDDLTKRTIRWSGACIPVVPSALPQTHMLQYVIRYAQSVQPITLTKLKRVNLMRTTTLISPSHAEEEEEEEEVDEEVARLNWTHQLFQVLAPILMDEDAAKRIMHQMLTEYQGGLANRLES